MSAAFSATIMTGALILPDGMVGMTEASTTRNPSMPCTRNVAGSTTDISSVPIAHVHDGCSAVSASRASERAVDFHVPAKRSLSKLALNFSSARAGSLNFS